MDKENNSSNDQNNTSSQPETPATSSSQPVQTEQTEQNEQNDMNQNTSHAPETQPPSPEPAADISSISVDKSEKALSIGRILFVIAFFAVIVGVIMGVMYFTKTGIFGEKRISAGNHSFVINENEWQISDVDETKNSITLNGNENNGAMMSISDNPVLTNYQYNDESAMQSLGIFGDVTSSEKNSGNVKCMVYDTTTDYQGVNISMKIALCNVSNDYNALLGVASQNSSMLDKYLDKGIEILKTGQK